MVISAGDVLSKVVLEQDGFGGGSNQRVVNSKLAKAVRTH